MEICLLRIPGSHLQPAEYVALVGLYFSAYQSLHGDKTGDQWLKEERSEDFEPKHRHHHRRRRQKRRTSEPGHPRAYISVSIIDQSTKR